jgi:hypothetical protein
MDRLQTIPGVDCVASAQLLAELGPDMSVLEMRCNWFRGPTYLDQLNENRAVRALGQAP